MLSLPAPINSKFNGNTTILVPAGYFDLISSNITSCVFISPMRRKLAYFFPFADILRILSTRPPTTGALNNLPKKEASGLFDTLKLRKYSGTCLALNVCVWQLMYEGIVIGF